MLRLDHRRCMPGTLAEFGQAVAPGAHGIVLMDKAGRHSSGDLVVPENPQPGLSAARLARTQSDQIASRTAFSRLLTRSLTAAVTPGIGGAAKPDGSGPYAPTLGSKGSATGPDVRLHYRL
jgi:hypothetical protein